MLEVDRRNLLNPPLFSAPEKVQAATQKLAELDDSAKKAIWEEIKRKQELPPHIISLDNLLTVIPKGPVDDAEYKSEYLTLIGLLGIHGKKIQAKEDQEKIIALLEEKQIGFEQFRVAVNLGMPLVFIVFTCPFLVRHFYRDKPKEFAEDLFSKKSTLPFKSAMTILRANKDWVDTSHLFEIYNQVKDSKKKLAVCFKAKGNIFSKLKEWVINLVTTDKELNTVNMAQLQALLANKTMRGHMALGKQKDFSVNLIKKTENTPEGAEFGRMIALDPFLTINYRLSLMAESPSIQRNTPVGRQYVEDHGFYMLSIASNRNRSFLRHGSVKCVAEAIKEKYIDPREAFFIAQKDWHRIAPSSLWGRKRREKRKEDLRILSPYFEARMQDISVKELALKKENKTYVESFLHKRESGLLDSIFSNEVRRFATLTELVVLSNLYIPIRKDIANTFLPQIKTETDVKELLKFALAPESQADFEQFLFDHKDATNFNQQLSEALVPYTTAVELITLSNRYPAIQEFIAPNIIEKTNTETEGKSVLALALSAEADQRQFFNVFLDKNPESYPAFCQAIAKVASAKQVNELATHYPQLKPNTTPIILHRLETETLPEITPESVAYIFESASSEQLMAISAKNPGLKEAISDDLLKILKQTAKDVSERARPFVEKVLSSQSIDDLAAVGAHNIALRSFIKQELYKKLLEHHPETPFEASTVLYLNDVFIPSLEESQYNKKLLEWSTEQRYSMLHEKVRAQLSENLLKLPAIQLHSFMLKLENNGTHRETVSTLFLQSKDLLKKARLELLKLPEEKAVELFTLYPEIALEFFKLPAIKEAESDILRTEVEGSMSAYQSQQFEAAEIERLAQIGSEKITKEIGTNNMFVVWLYNKDIETYGWTYAKNLSPILNNLTCSLHLQKNALLYLFEGEERGTLFTAFASESDPGFQFQEHFLKLMPPENKDAVIKAFEKSRILTLHCPGSPQRAEKLMNVSPPQTPPVVRTELEQKKGSTLKTIKSLQVLAGAVAEKLKEEKGGKKVPFPQLERRLDFEEVPPPSAGNVSPRNK